MPALRVSALLRRLHAAAAGEDRAAEGVPTLRAACDDLGARRWPRLNERRLHVLC